LEARTALLVFLYQIRIKFPFVELNRILKNCSVE